MNNTSASEDPQSSVYVGAPILYYEKGHDSSYGTGTEEDAHTEQEAADHTVVTITQPGIYRISGNLSMGQIAVDLGEDAITDPNAVVTLILDNTDITCTVAPAILFYRVYECASEDTLSTWEASTTDAGANIMIEDGTENTVRGSYVAGIYSPDTPDLLSEYSGAIYSRMSLNIGGGIDGTGRLSVTGDKKGLCSELHLTVNGAFISVTSQDDGIYAQKDNRSVVTINGGDLTINAGLGDQGYGIRSNGYLAINGGTVFAIANGSSGSSGLNSLLGTYLNGGEIFTLGSQNSPVEEDSKQDYLAFLFSGTQGPGSIISITDDMGMELMNYTSGREYTSLLYSSPQMQEDISYTVSVNGQNMESLSSENLSIPEGSSKNDSLPSTVS